MLPLQKCAVAVRPPRSASNWMTMIRVEAQPVARTSDLIVIDRICSRLLERTLRELAHGILPLPGAWTHHREVVPSVRLVSTVRIRIESSDLFHTGIRLSIAERDELRIPKPSISVRHYRDSARTEVVRQFRHFRFHRKIFREVETHPS